MIRFEGVRSLWAGYFVTLMRDVPFAAVYFLSYEYGKMLQKKLIDKKQLAAPNHLLAGAIAGGVRYEVNSYILCYIIIDYIILYYISFA